MSSILSQINFITPADITSAFSQAQEAKAQQQRIDLLQKQHELQTREFKLKELQFPKQLKKLDLDIEAAIQKLNKEQFKQRQDQTAQMQKTTLQENQLLLGSTNRILRAAQEAPDMLNRTFAEEIQNLEQAAQVAGLDPNLRAELLGGGIEKIQNVNRRAQQVVGLLGDVEAPQLLETAMLDFAEYDVTDPNDVFAAQRDPAVIAKMRDLQKPKKLLIERTDLTQAAKTELQRQVKSGTEAMRLINNIENIMAKDPDGRLFTLWAKGEEAIGAGLERLGIDPGELKDTIVMKQSLRTVGLTFALRLLRSITGAQMTDQEREFILGVVGHPDRMSKTQYMSAIRAYKAVLDGDIAFGKQLLQDGIAQAKEAGTLDEITTQGAVIEERGNATIKEQGLSTNLDADRFPELVPTGDEEVLGALERIKGLQ